MHVTRLLLTTGLALGLAAAPAMSQERISIGTGGTGGLFYVIGAGIAEMLNQHMPDAFARAEVTGASVENIRRVANDEMTFGFSSSSTLYEASVGEGPFEEPLPVAAMAYLYPAVLQIATTADTGIEDLNGLAGKRINLGPPGSNSAVLVERLLSAYGVFDPANAQYISYNEGTAALMNGTIDATVVLAGAPTAALIDLGAQRVLQLRIRPNGRAAPALADLLRIGVEDRLDVEALLLEVAVAQQRDTDATRPDQRHTVAAFEAQDRAQRGRQLFHAVAAATLAEGAEKRQVLAHLSG